MAVVVHGVGVHVWEEEEKRNPSQVLSEQWFYAVWGDLCSATEKTRQ